MIWEFAFAVAAAAGPDSGVSFKLESAHVTQIPYIQAYTGCFEHAVVETKNASSEEQRRRYELCRAAHADFVAKYNAETPSPGLQEKRGFERNLNVIESAYADAMAKQWTKN
jgi:hypothetical protein